VARLLFRRRELSLGVGAYIASDNTLHQKSGLHGHVSKTIVLELLHFTVNRLLTIGNASQHLLKFFSPISFAAAFSPNFLPPKFFTTQ